MQSERMFESLKERLKGLFSRGEEKKEDVAQSAKEELQEMRQAAPEPRGELPQETAEEARKSEDELHEQEYERAEKTANAEEPREENVQEFPEIKETAPAQEENTAALPKQEKKGFLSGLLKKITEKTLEEKDINNITVVLKLALMENDVALDVAEKICDDVKASLVGKNVGRGDAEKETKRALKEAIKNVMKQPDIDLQRRIAEKQGTFTILVFGSNGAGKTTTIAKLAHALKEFSPVVAAGDTFRAASIEQLEEHARRAGFELVKHTYGADSAAVIFDARKHAEARGAKLVIGDTAGRSHANANLMDELKKVARVNNPDMKILILDSLTGNDIYEQAKRYDEAVGIDAMILTKADVYGKGGACLSATYVTKKPILYLGTGQNYEDLEKFDADKIADELLG